MTDKVHIIAGNHIQFQQFRTDLCRSMITEGIPFNYSDIKYLGRPESLRGLTDIWGYRVGTWHKRNDIEELKLMLIYQQSSIDNFIEVM